MSNENGLTYAITESGCELTWFKKREDGSAKDEPCGKEPVALTDGGRRVCFRCAGIVRHAGIKTTDLPRPS